MSSEKHRGLAGGIAAAHEHYLGALAELCLVGRRGVVDSRALEPRATLDPEPAVLRAGGYQQALGGKRLAPLQA